jgi:hypothetical protein
MTNNKKQTAVEWLIEQFWNNEGMLTSKKLEKALEMEKEMHRKELDLAYQDGREIEHIQNTIEKNKHKHTEVTNENNNFKF